MTEPRGYVQYDCLMDKQYDDELCPNGGVDGNALDDQEEPENQEDQEADEIKAHLLCVNEDKTYCETCFTRDRCIYLRTYNLIEKQQAEIKRLKPKEGHWIRTGEKNCYGGTVVVCSCCDDKFVCSNVGLELYCRHCGAAMTD